jgi:hypothetical protein
MDGVQSGPLFHNRLLKALQPYLKVGRPCSPRIYFTPSPVFPYPYRPAGWVTAWDASGRPAGPLAIQPGRRNSIYAQIDESNF